MKLQKHETAGTVVQMVPVESAIMSEAEVVRSPLAEKCTELLEKIRAHNNACKAEAAGAVVPMVPVESAMPQGDHVFSCMAEGMLSLKQFRQEETQTVCKGFTGIHSMLYNSL